MEQIIDLKRLRFERNLSQQKLGEMLNVTKQQISNIESGKSKLTNEQKEILYQNFGTILQSQMTTNTDILSDEDCALIDYYPEVFGSCGSGAFVLSEQKELVQVPKKLFTSFSAHKKYSVINAVGDSMSPFINDKDRLIVEHWSNEQIKDNQVYVFCYKDEIFIKRLIKNIDEIIVKSDNPDPIYRARYIEKDDLNNIIIIGQIVGLMREF